MNAEELTAYLQNEISNKSSPEEIVDSFEKMCAIPMDDDPVLFEALTYGVMSEPAFHFILVRQVPNGGDEYYRISVDVSYAPSEKTDALRQCAWSDGVDNIFDYIRNSQEFAVCKNMEFTRVDVYPGET